jgi:hypothetical protein
MCDIVLVLTIAPVRTVPTESWSAETCHRFLLPGRLVGRAEPRSAARENPRTTRDDGDKSPAESADKSAHSKSGEGRGARGGNDWSPLRRHGDLPPGETWTGGEPVSGREIL